MKIETELDKKYGILLSGGIDSAILMYLLVKENPKIKLQPFTIPKFDGAALYADPIIAHFNKKFNLQIPSTIFVGDPTAHHSLQSKTAIIEILQLNIVDYLFMGTNQNPPELNDMLNAPQRVKKSEHPKILLPFIEMYKDQILKLMFENQQEDLMNITHTCTEMSATRCNVCWQCTERIWAFNQLNKTDTGCM